MYQITAIFNKSCLEDVLTELYDREIEGVTVMDVVGKGGLGFREKGKMADLNPKIMILLVVSNDHFKNIAMEAIRTNTQDLGHGAGKMWITPVLEVERIRTGEKNSAALSASQYSGTKSAQNYFSSMDTPSS